jgi:MFS family permease
LSSYVQCFGLIINSLCLPTLGWVGDHLGRRQLVILYFAGLAASAVLNAIRQSIVALFVAAAVHESTNALSPALLAMINDEVLPNDRMFAYLLCVAAWAPAFGLGYVAVTHFVVAAHWHSYRGTWLSIAGASFAIALLSLCVPETLRKEEVEPAPSTSSDPDTPRKKIPRGCARTLVLHWLCGGVRLDDPLPAHALMNHLALPSLRFIALVEAPLLFGVNAFTTLDGFALTAYGWEQEAMYYAKLIALPSAMLAILLSVVLMRTVGPLRTLQLGLLSIASALALMCIAQWDVTLLYVALASLGGSGFMVLPVLKLLSSEREKASQASATAAILAVAHAAQAAGLAVHGYLFERSASVGVLYAPFALGLLSTLAALMIATLCVPPERVWLWEATDDVEWVNPSNPDHRSASKAIGTSGRRRD